jgi:putative redox protein
MHQMTVVYEGELRTEALHLDSKNVIHTDAPKDNQGKGEAFSPTDLMCTSLASCMLTIMAMKARSLGIETQGVSIEVEKKMQASPRKVAEIVLKFDWKGLDQRLSGSQLEELKQAALTCPVALSLDPSVKKTLVW